MFVPLRKSPAYRTLERLWDTEAQRDLGSEVRSGLLDSALLAFGDPETVGVAIQS